jgi:hypothetical protein
MLVTALSVSILSIPRTENGEELNLGIRRLSQATVSKAAAAEHNTVFFGSLVWSLSIL